MSLAELTSQPKRDFEGSQSDPDRAHAPVEGFTKADSGLLLPVDHSGDARPTKSVERDALRVGMAEGRGSYRYSDKLSEREQEEKRQDYFSDIRKMSPGSLVTDEEAQTMHVAKTHSELEREAAVLPKIINEARARHEPTSEAELYYEDVQRRLAEAKTAGGSEVPKPHFYPGVGLSGKLEAAAQATAGATPLPEDKPGGETPQENPETKPENETVWKPTVRITSDLGMNSKDESAAGEPAKPQQAIRPEHPGVWKPTVRPTLAVGFDTKPDSPDVSKDKPKAERPSEADHSAEATKDRLLPSKAWDDVVARGKESARKLGLTSSPTTTGQGSAVERPTESANDAVPPAEDTPQADKVSDAQHRPGRAYHEPMDIRTRPAFVYDSDPEVLRSSTVTISSVEERFLHDADGMRREFFSPNSWHGPDFSPITSHVERVHEACLAFTREIINNPNQPDLTRELLRDQDYAPVSSVLVGDREFYLSKVFVAGSRSMALGYTLLDSGQVAPRIFYKSMSSGGWRAPEYVAPNGHLGKGGDPRVYTNGTQVRGELATMLDGLEDQGFVVASSRLDEDSSKWYTPYSPGQSFEYRGPVLGRELLTWAKEVQVLAPDQKFEDQTSAFLPGYGFRTEAGARARDYFAALSTELDDAVESAFARPPRRIDYDGHTLLGPIFRETYQVPLPTAWLENLRTATGSGDIGSLDIEMCFDNEGRTWVGNIRYSGAPVTSYGTDAFVIPGGMLLNKPLEYSSQVMGLEPGVDYEPFEGSQYVDISPLIEKLKIIRLFKRLRVIPATRRDTREEDTQYFPVEST